MNEQMPPSINSSISDDLIGEELDKLFAFQDRILSEKKRAILIKALSDSGLPKPAIFLGIRKLFNDDINSIKLSIILSAARSHVEPEERLKCEDCSEGFVPMRDEQGQWFSMACHCSLGNLRNQWQKLSRWRGEGKQFSNGRILTKAAMGMGSGKKRERGNVNG